MKANFLAIFERCVETGVTLGYNMAHKHNDSPSEREVTDEITRCIEYGLHELIEFDGGRDDTLFRRIIRADENTKRGDPLRDYLDGDDIANCVSLLAELLRVRDF